MVPRTPAQKLTLLLLAAVVAGCASLKASVRAPSECYPRQCALHVQNDYDRIIGVRYFDSTGAGDRLGSVKARAVERFELGVRTARRITVEVMHEGQRYRSFALLSPPRSENVIHFPADFPQIVGR